MKHFITLALLIGFAYTAWQVVDPAAKAAAKAFLKRHAPALLISATLLFLALAGAVYTNAINIL